jgi:predicted aspartyl protease/tetratricopeptide (TPR) repeat protein
LIRFAFSAIVCAFSILPTWAFSAEKCEFATVAELPITMNGLRPMISGQINGKDAHFMVDSGAFFNVMSAATATEYGLRTSPAPFGFRITGIGGEQTADIARVKDFTLAGLHAKDVDFFVAGSESAGAGVLGQNLLENFDVEYDLGNGMIRLFKTKNCDHAQLAYWLKPGQSYSSMPLDAINRRNAHTTGVAYLNGTKIKIVFDTGAYLSMLNQDAAARAGVKPDSEGVTEAGYSSGVGRRGIKTYVGRFSSFKIGDGEEIKNAKLRFGEADLLDGDMLLGADFFISHRIFVGNHEHRVVLSYGGGPVFDLSKKPLSQSAAENSPPADKPANSQNSAATPATEAADTNPAELARKGSAMVARQEYDPGLALLSKAIELSPNDPEFFFQRASGYWANKQADLALADFNQVIKLKSDFLPAYIPRAELQLFKRNRDAAVADLETVGRLAPKPADLRLALAELDDRLDMLPAGLENYNLWIENHPDDSRMVHAQAGRCVNRMLQNKDLPAALSDCNAAARHSDKSTPGYPQLLVDRAAVRLRTGEFDKAIADCNDALKIAPKTATALYVRAVAESKKNKSAESQADLAAARAINPQAGARLERYGVTL